jgi:hypothetical protein
MISMMPVRPDCPRLGVVQLVYDFLGAIMRPSSAGVYFGEPARTRRLGFVGDEVSSTCRSYEGAMYLRSRLGNPAAELLLNVSGSNKGSGDLENGVRSQKLDKVQMICM